MHSFSEDLRSFKSYHSCRQVLLLILMNETKSKGLISAMQFSCKIPSPVKNACRFYDYTKMSPGI